MNRAGEVAVVIAASLASISGGCGGADRATPVPARYDCPPSGAACASRCDALGYEPLVAVEAADLPASPPAADVRVRVRFVVTTSWPDGDLAFDAADARDYLANMVGPTQALYAACGIGIDVDGAEIAAVPARLLSLDGNAPGAWGGLAPPGEDPDAWNYAQNERLPADVAELLGAARHGAGASTIAVAVLDDVFYYAAGVRTHAGGLSYPPVVYHAAADFPARNGVLVGTGYMGCGELPIALSPRIVAHELGHMLTDSAQHSTDPTNVMSELFGESITPAQCALMRANATTLYGGAPVVDPGPPAAP